MNEIAPDIVSFLADMPLLDDVPPPAKHDGAMADGPQHNRHFREWLPPSVALGRHGRRASHQPGLGDEAALDNWLGFRIGELGFAVPFDSASELSEMVPAYRLPNSPNWFLGLSNLHGNLVPVLDIAAMIGLKSGPASARMMLVLGHGHSATGILVDGLPRRIRLSSAAGVATPSLPESLGGVFPGPICWSSRYGSSCGTRSLSRRPARGCWGDSR